MANLPLCPSGIWNNNPEDDFRMPNGSTITPSSSEATLFHYGMTCESGQSPGADGQARSVPSTAIPPVSLPGGEKGRVQGPLIAARVSRLKPETALALHSHSPPSPKPREINGTGLLGKRNDQLPSNFTPVFYDQLQTNSSSDQDLISSCDGDRSCIYDALATRNTSIGRHTLALHKTYERVNATFNQYPPSIEGHHVVEAYKGQTVLIQYTSDAENVTFMLRDNCTDLKLFGPKGHSTEDAALCLSPALILRWLFLAKPKPPGSVFCVPFASLPEFLSLCVSEGTALPVSSQV
ncbi:hypothetical protein P7K49_031264 [Saguinus oedipus]|uniref:Mucin-4-like C8-3 domain-containing protein n=1 Tax=Saguinus oedipus TaxID=9490 RepID=A0ABQ9U026_SAGOE|nr:hypothetical protein P7K49_031264 [Saguinus oedipus]